MTIADKLNYLNDTKQAIKQAITDKGVEVLKTDTFRSYADKIASIEVGGGTGAEYKSSLMATTTQSAYSPSIVSLSDYVLPDYTIKKEQTGLLYPKRTTTVEAENFTKVGKVVVEGKVVSTFSMTDYLSFADAGVFDASVPWVVKTKVYLTSIDPIESEIVRLGNGIMLRANRYNWKIIMQDSSKNLFVNSISSSTWNLNTWYWLEMSWDGFVYRLNVSTNGSDYTNVISVSSSVPAYNTKALNVLGSDSTTPTYIGGTGRIDLSETEIIQNGSLWWRPYTEQNGYPSEVGNKDNFFIHGTPSISRDYIVSAFSSVDYLEQHFENTPTAIKCISKVKFNSVQSGNAVILLFGGFLGIASGRWWIWTGSNTYGGSISSNTTYWTCVTIIDGIYNLYTLVDNGTYKSVDDLPDLTGSVWTHSISNASGEGASSVGRRLVIGRDTTFSDRFFNGAIYLKDTVLTDPKTGSLIWSYRRGYVDGICTKDFMPQVGTNTLNAYHIEYTDGTSECLLGQTEPTGTDIKSVQLLESGLTFEEDKAWTYNEDSEQFE